MGLWYSLFEVMYSVYRFLLKWWTSLLYNSKIIFVAITISTHTIMIKNNISTIYFYVFLHKSSMCKMLGWMIFHVFRSKNITKSSFVFQYRYSLCITKCNLMCSRTLTKTIFCNNCFNFDHEQLTLSLESNMFFWKVICCITYDQQWMIAL